MVLELRLWSCDKGTFVCGESADLMIRSSSSFAVRLKNGVQAQLGKGKLKSTISAKIMSSSNNVLFPVHHPNTATPLPTVQDAQARSITERIPSIINKPKSSFNNFIVRFCNIHQHFRLQSRPSPIFQLRRHAKPLRKPADPPYQRGLT